MGGGFFGELKRRNVPRAAILYIGSVWALAQGIASLAPVVGAPEGVTRWFLAAAAIGLPFWLVFSWRFEFTAHGIKPDSEAAQAPAAERRTANRRADLAIIGVLAIAVVLLLTDRLVERPAPVAPARAAAVPGERSIAVLPLANESGDDAQQYFSDGLSEGFIIALSRIDGLRVIGRNSSFQFRDSREGSQAIAARLGVTHLLEGSVRRLGDTVRISASLVKADDGSTVWAEQYDRPYRDLFALQDQVTAAVAKALQAKLRPPAREAGGNDRPPGGNVEAYNAYLRGVAAAELPEALAAFDEAIALDPAYGLAHAKKARALVAAASQMAGAEARDAYAAADAAVAAAMRLAPEAASTRIARGWLLMTRDLDWRGAQAEFERAVQVAPGDADALYQLGVARASQGDLRQAVALTRRALERDPLQALWYPWLASYLMPLGELDGAEQAIGKAIELQPQAVSNHALLATAKLLRKDAAGAGKAAEGEPPGPWRDFALALARQAGADRGAADAALRDFTARYPSGWSFQIAQLHAARGEPDAMFAALEQARAARDPGMQSLLYDALLLRYRDDPRYAALARSVGLPWPPQGASVAAAP